MKKAFFLFLIFFIFLSITDISFSQETSIPALTSSFPTVDYQLQWPGMLPDDKFYKLKLLRDKIIVYLVKNPIKKIEYNLIQADKTIYAGKLLFDKGNLTLAKETALKGENFYTQMVTEYKWAYWYGNKIPDSLNNRIKNAALKHQEVFYEMMKKYAKEDQKTFQMLADFSKRNYQELLDIKKPSKK